MKEKIRARGDSDLPAEILPNLNKLTLHCCLFPCLSMGYESWFDYELMCIQ
jgi:hypothetical protein